MLRKTYETLESKSMSKSIRLDIEKRHLLKQFATDIIFEEFKKLKYYEEFMEIRKEFGQELYSYLMSKFPKSKTDIFTEICQNIKNDSMLYIKPSFKIQINRFQDISYKLRSFGQIVSVRDGFSNTVSNFINYIDLPKEFHFTHHDFKYKIHNIELFNYLELYVTMLNDIVCFIHHERCPYDLLIGKKTTLQTLAKVWPACIKFKDEWGEKDKEDKVINMSCGLMSEQDAINRIQNKGV